MEVSPEEILKSYEDVDWVSHYKNNSLTQLKVMIKVEKHGMAAYLSLKKKKKYTSEYCFSTTEQITVSQ